MLQRFNYLCLKHWTHCTVFESCLSDIWKEDQFLIFGAVISNKVWVSRSELLTFVALSIISTCEMGVENAICQAMFVFPALANCSARVKETQKRATFGPWPPQWFFVRFQLQGWISGEKTLFASIFDNYLVFDYFK